MMIRPFLTGVACVLCAMSVQAQDVEVLRKGKTFIETKTYTLEEDQALLEKFEGLRVADVCDGMDKVGLPDVGLMHHSIKPLWKDTEEFTHRIIGIAVTARYVPTQTVPPQGLDTEEFDAWVGRTYSQKTPEPFTALLREGSVVVIEEAPHTDVGTIGSNNIMSWISKGAVGVITSETARDTDEIIAQGIPLYYKNVGRGIRPGRNRIDSVNRPVVCGGALVMPGDVVVADGDGVIVVPRDAAEEVAEYAHDVIANDKAGRRALYQKLGIPEDPSVK